MSTSKHNSLRIVFMGTPDFAVGSLKQLLEAGFKVVGVITAPDRPAGRGRKLQESAVKQFAVKHQLKVLQPTNLKDEAFLKDLKSLDANLQVVVAFRMLPKVVWQMPAYGTFNLHASLLPQYRGAAPINWAIINGETETGVTTFFIDEKIDTGNIILQKGANIRPDDNAGNLHDRLMELGAHLVVETCKQIEAGTVSLQKQDESMELKPAPKIHKDTCRIDWNSPMMDIYNHIRGLSPYPGAWTELVNDGKAEPMKIFRTEMETSEHDYIVGKLVVEKKSLKVAVKEGYLNLLELQLPGKRRMQVNEVLNGLNLEKEAHLR
ncbi:MAG: methionyl-tRNA formyltransferase [Muricauda sp.]|nr:methionyl-tRNA formyltransferase [Allomuricauda sp.]MBO6533273.1 methionyl-tRNA formyltransferase [Allomuricauda sp.]MBO6589653.1 methionyl-tRNA formyltransferase [Allomuricauda sp.]MBO6619414.1 methionyl-tRNA formyltransferase [Allomuricauda sp.]MBO6645325.1 methionyl-tRNA formyltransferase [Allomuricauda sp.]MBO6747399.1 methionyl-tRNA formyltransferase [Allomuricauda sp.]